MGKVREIAEKFKLSPKAKKGAKSVFKSAGLLVVGGLIGYAVGYGVTDYWWRQYIREHNYKPNYYCPQCEKKDCGKESGEASRGMLRLAHKIAMSDNRGAAIGIESVEGMIEKGLVGEGELWKLERFVFETRGNCGGALHLLKRVLEEGEGKGIAEAAEEVSGIVKLVARRAGKEGVEMLKKASWYYGVGIGELFGIVEEIEAEVGGEGLFGKGMGIVAKRMERLHINRWMEREGICGEEVVLGMCRVLRKLSGMERAEEIIEEFEADIIMYGLGEGIYRIWEIAAEKNFGRELIEEMEKLPMSKAKHISRMDYEEGMEIARRALGVQNVPLVDCVRFGYGVHTVGAEKAERMFEEFGIRKFTRYSEELLQGMAEGMGSGHRGKPVFLAIVAKNDWNGGFDSMRELDSAIGHYRVFVMEASKEREIYSGIRMVAEEYGKVEVLVLAGHGNVSSINFGDYSEREMIDLTDMRGLLGIRGCFVEEPVLVLESCSTGRHRASISAMLGDIFGGRVFAPVRDSSVQKYETDGEGRIAGVEYGVPTSIYEDGEWSVVGAP